METGEQAKSRIKTIALDRQQIRWAEFDLDALIEEDHPARTIWELSGRFDLKQFEAKQKTREGEAGRPINYHTLADFRVGHKEALNDLFAQFLTLLETVGLVDLQTLLHDGTKVRAVAGRASLHRRKPLEKRLRKAKQVLTKLQAQAEAEEEACDKKRRAAQQRTARERLDRAQAALEKVTQLESETFAGERAELRVSDSEAEARKMKHADGSWARSYNLQVTTEAQSRMIAGIGVTDAANDTQQLLPALETVQNNCGALPEKIIADNGYATRDNVEQTSQLGVELIAPWEEDQSRQAGACKRNGIEVEFASSTFSPQRGGKKLTCPAGKTLVLIQQKVPHGLLRDIFEARAADCRRCRHRQACCGDRGGPRRVERVLESAAMKQYLTRMKQRAVKELYGKRNEIAEFPHMWAKAVKGWRRFSVRGLVKAGMEAVWVALAYNLTQYLRLKPAPQAAA